MTHFTVSVNSLLAGEAEFCFVQSKPQETNMQPQKKKEVGNPSVN